MVLTCWIASRVAAVVACVAFAAYCEDCANLDEVRHYVNDWKDEADHYDFYLNTERGSRRILNPLK